mmetsp:Transcript_40197/g.78555  ORF Transcript_40197/g.78555 Transcript_40197/m.78555 type:complete len:227 (-) Transcript_40197:979-1659(-)
MYWLVIKLSSRFSVVKEADRAVIVSSSNCTLSCWSTFWRNRSSSCLDFKWMFSAAVFLVAAFSNCEIFSVRCVTRLPAARHSFFEAYNSWTRPVSFTSTRPTTLSFSSIMDAIDLSFRICCSLFDATAVPNFSSKWTTSFFSTRTAVSNVEHAYRDVCNSWWRWTSAAWTSLFDASELSSTTFPNSTMSPFRLCTWLHVWALSIFAASISFFIASISTSILSFGGS